MQLTVRPFATTGAANIDDGDDDDDDNDYYHRQQKRLYNKPSYSRILIGSCLFSIRGQIHY